MAVLVNLDDVLDICSHYCPDDDGTCSKAGSDLREMLDEIEALPVVEPRAKGEWIVDKYGDVICSKCHRPAPMIMTGCLANRHLEYDKSDFCWHCGADMRGGQDDI